MNLTVQNRTMADWIVNDPFHYKYQLGQWKLCSVDLVGERIVWKRDDWDVFIEATPIEGDDVYLQIELPGAFCYGNCLWTSIGDRHHYISAIMGILPHPNPSAHGAGLIGVRTRHVGTKEELKMMHRDDIKLHFVLGIHESGIVEFRYSNTFKANKLPAHLYFTDVLGIRLEEIIEPEENSL